jgi:hypothetical protein
LWGATCAAGQPERERVVTRVARAAELGSLRLLMCLGRGGERLRGERAA